MSITNTVNRNNGHSKTAVMRTQTTMSITDAMMGVMSNPCRWPARGLA